MFIFCALLFLIIQKLFSAFDSLLVPSLDVILYFDKQQNPRLPETYDVIITHVLGGIPWLHAKVRTVETASSLKNLRRFCP